MNFWLFKSEPNTWSWDDQVKKGEIGEHWDVLEIIKHQII